MNCAWRALRGRTGHRPADAPPTPGWPYWGWRHTAVPPAMLPNQGGLAHPWNAASWSDVRTRGVFGWRFCPGAHLLHPLSSCSICPLPFALRHCPLLGLPLLSTNSREAHSSRCLRRAGFWVSLSTPDKRAGLRAWGPWWALHIPGAWGAGAARTARSPCRVCSEGTAGGGAVWEGPPAGLLLSWAPVCPEPFPRPHSQFTTHLITEMRFKRTG